MSEATRTAYRTCPLCEATCGLEITLEGDRVTRIRGDADDVFSGGFICPKGTTLGELHDDPDRLHKPLVKRDGKHVEVEWDEAYAAVEAGVERVREASGNESIGAYLGNPNVHNLGGTFFVRPLLQSLKTRNLFSASTVDQMPRHVSCGLMYGNPDTIPVPDLDRTDYLLMLGANPLESNGSLCTAPDFPGRLKRLRERGGQLVVVDPRTTRTARLADRHLAIRPGTDGHFLLAIANVLFEEGLVDYGALSEHLEDREGTEAAVAPFGPARVAEVSGIPEAEIRKIAREIAGANSAAVYGRIGVHTAEFGTLTSWASDLLTILTGNFDRVGGMLFPYPAHARPRRKGQEGKGRGFTTGRWQSRVRGVPEVRSELPIATLADEIETEGAGQIRALFTVGGNPILSAPNGERLDTAFAGLSFMVSVDPYLNETTRHADVILPPTSALERSHYDASFYNIAVRSVANYSPPVLETDAPGEEEILSRLALVVGGHGTEADPALLQRMLVRGLIEREVGSEHSLIHGRDADEIETAVAGRPAAVAMLDVLLRTGPWGDAFGGNPDGLSIERLEAHPHGIDLGALEPAVPAALSTPSGKIDVFPEALRQDVTRLTADLGSRCEAASKDDTQLVLVGRRTVRSNNSWMHNVDTLMRGRDRCTLQIHPEDASRVGLATDGRARVTSRVGSVEAPIEITDEIRPGVVCLPHGYGHDLHGTGLSVAAKTPGVNSNRLTDDQPLDVLSGNAVLNGIPVEVEAAGS
ncbi:MAG: molybdopterin-dependent oxidoreductase [Myxococcota bacterium]|jgi:anaerobic selenocysteine-containing dehydrogenase|nr:molybdopterin-dependent oxidoreductase [Myxococcota bacterium]